MIHFAPFTKGFARVGAQALAGLANPFKLALPLIALKLKGFLYLLALGCLG